MDFDYPDMPFPIERCSKRVANALLREFDGRVPSLAEVMAYRDNDWLGTPGFGRKALDEIKEIKTTLDPSPPIMLRPKMSDAELVLHLYGQRVAGTDITRHLCVCAQPDLLGLAAVYAGQPRCLEQQ